MKILKYCISFALVASAIVLLLDAVFLTLVTTTILVPAEMLNSSTGLEVARILARYGLVAGSITFLLGGYRVGNLLQEQKPVRSG